jgi:hypothetical protein
VRELAGLVASNKKIEANRKNAKKSTGPRTQRGKSHARWNALKHAAFATQRLIRGEDEKAYQQLSARVFAEAMPKTAVESMLVDQIVGDMWRLRRVEQAERAYFEQIRASALARALRALSGAESRLVPEFIEGAERSTAEGGEPISCSASQKLQAATHPDKLMLDGMVSPQRAFPYSTLDQIRRSLVRDVLRKGARLAELRAHRLTIAPE